MDISDGTLIIPSGDTASRTGINTSTGDFRYNTTTGKVEFYNGTGWENIGTSQPLINNISPSSFSGAAGTSITLIGQNFVSGANVHFVSSVNGSSTAAGSVAFVNSGIMTAITPLLTTAGEPYGVKVTNPDGGQTLLEAALDAGSSPTWTTSAGSIGSGIQKNTTLSGISVNATDPDGQAITYSEVTSVLTSNADTPATTMGLTLNSSTGAITGTAPNVSSDTTYNFTIRASDGINTTDRNFSLGIQAASNPLYWFRGSAHGGTGASDTSVVTGWFPLLVTTPVVAVVVMQIMTDYMFIRLVILELVLVFINIYPQIIQQPYLQTTISLELYVRVKILFLIIICLVGVLLEHQEPAIIM